MPRFPTHTLDVCHPDGGTGPRVMGRRRLGYRVTTVLLVALVAAAVLDGIADGPDLFGVDADTVTVSGSGYDLTVLYPSVARPALAAPFEVEIRSADGFSVDVELAVDREFLEIWDVNGIFPEPTEQRSEGDRIVWTFDAPEGQVFHLFYEARIEPARQNGADGRVELLEDGATVLVAEWHTRILP